MIETALLSFNIRVRCVFVVFVVILILENKLRYEHERFNNL